jgi:hypothetical protein
MLLGWKADREAEGREALAGLTRMTDNGLREIIIEAFSAKQELILKTLSRLEQNDTQAVEIMRRIPRELNQFPAHGAYLNSETVEILKVASSRLTKTANNAELLMHAVIKFDEAGVRHLPTALAESLDSMTRISDSISSLRSLVDRLETLTNM